VEPDRESQRDTLYGPQPSTSTVVCPDPCILPPAFHSRRRLSVARRRGNRLELDLAGVKGGVVIHLGIGDGSLAKALRANSSYQVQGLDTDPAKVTSTRKLVADGVYGAVSVERYDETPPISTTSPIVVAEDASGVSAEEIDRRPRPNGVALTRQDGEWVKRVKERDPRLDERTHYYYDAKGNAVSKDEVVGPPERLQMVGSPRWSRHHDRMSSLSAQVTAGGRIFSIMDEAPGSPSCFLPSGP